LCTFTIYSKYIHSKLQVLEFKQQVWPLLRHHVLATPFQVRQILVRKQDMGYKPDTGMKLI
jgi:hypothetical protein